MKLHEAKMTRVGATRKERLHGNDGGSGPALARHRFWGLSYKGWVGVTLAVVVILIVAL